MKAKIVLYKFLSKKNAKYLEICKEMKQVGFRKSDTLKFQIHRDYFTNKYFYGIMEDNSTMEIDVELETKHIFEDQWNSDLGRIHDWFEEVDNGKERSAYGYYIDFGPEIADLRTQKVCGYCGARKAEENNHEWIAGYHVGCPVKYLDRDLLFLTKEDRIWAGHKGRNKEDVIPELVLSYFHHRKVNFVMQEAKKREQDLYDSWEEFERRKIYQLEEFKTKKKVIEDLAEKKLVYVDWCDIILYKGSKEKLPVLSIDWSTSSRRSEIDAQKIKEFFEENSEDGVVMKYPIYFTFRYKK